MSKCEICNFPDGSHSVGCREMTDSEKLQAIEDMGIGWNLYCPDDYKLKQRCTLPLDGCVEEHCGTCWIKALEA
jgi:hypothetical protein